MDAEPRARLSMDPTCPYLDVCLLNWIGKMFAPISLGYYCIRGRENIFTGTLLIAKNSLIIHIEDRDIG